MARRELFISLYSIKELPVSIRPDFKIPHYPFSRSPTGPLSEETLELFQNLGVIHYRDHISPMGILIQPLDDNPTPLEHRSGFLAYKTNCLLGFKSLEILEWEPNQDPSKHRRIKRRWGDLKCWMRWNRACTVRQMHETQVRAS